MNLLNKKNLYIFTNRFAIILIGDSLERGSIPLTSTTYPHLLKIGLVYTIECGHFQGGDLVSTGYTKIRRESKPLLNDNTLTKALAESAIAYSKAPETMVKELALELA